MKCKCGFENDYVPQKGSYSVGNRMKESGFYPIFDGEGDIVWICQTCAEQCNEMAKKIYDITGVKYIYLNQLLSMFQKN